jgi:hypothetical protein
MNNPPSFRHTVVVDNKDWNNYHGTVAHHHVPIVAVVDALADTTSAQTPPWQRQGEALKDILTYCFNAQPPEPVRAIGATWSLSDIVSPSRVIIDPGRMNAIVRVSDAWCTDAYKAARPPGSAAMIIEGGARIFDINNALGNAGLALATSGASDGHRLAGCIATGTHGSAIGIGAVHDTVRAVYLVVAPDRAVFVQPATGRPFADDVGKWLGTQSGFPTENVVDDEAFAAAMVSLGSLGFVHSVVVEAVPLYRLRGRMLPMALGDAMVLQAIRSMDTKPLHPDIGQRPYHFSVLINPYAPPGTPGFFVGLYWKEDPKGAPFAPASPALPMAPSDTAGVVASLIKLLDGPIAGPIVEHVISSVLSSQNPRKDFDPAFPGQVFGPTTLTAGHGMSTEIVVDQANAVDAIGVLLRTLDAQRNQGRHLLGAIGCRFVPATGALLGMNVAAMNCYLELGSLANANVPPLHQACWAALDAAKIPYTCHWGQQHQLDEPHLRAYFGSRVDRWKQARDRLLQTATAKTVFSAPSLAKVGLV